MEQNTYFDALLYLLRVIVYADGVFDEDEVRAIKDICKQEDVSEEYYGDFVSRTKGFSEKKMYQNGIDMIQECTLDEQLRTFAWLYKIAEVDGKVHVKEVRFLLYSLRHTDIEFAQVEKKAGELPAILV
ncbi:MAG: TerB family tellurite resistance protein [Cyclobacteriaceae bacterium]|nr:TerB family tellurite resistance protein [Cyclobacteriaceae bacterium]